MDVVVDTDERLEVEVVELVEAMEETDDDAGIGGGEREVEGGRD